MDYTVSGVTKSQTRLSDFHFTSLRCYGARQAPLPMGFSRQEYWSGLPFPSLGDLRNLGIKPTSLKSGALAGRFFTTGATWEIHTHTHTHTYTHTDTHRHTHIHTYPLLVRLPSPTAGRYCILTLLTPYARVENSHRVPSAVSPLSLDKPFLFFLFLPSYPAPSPPSFLHWLLSLEQSN